MFVKCERELIKEIVLDDELRMDIKAKITLRKACALFTPEKKENMIFACSFPLSVSTKFNS
jgi:hypothetical protein